MVGVKTPVQYELIVAVSASLELQSRGYVPPTPLRVGDGAAQLIIGNSKQADVRLPVMYGISDEHGDFVIENGKVVYADRFTPDGTDIRFSGRLPVRVRDRQPMELADLLGEAPPQPVRLTFPGVDGLAINLTFSRKA